METQVLNEMVAEQAIEIAQLKFQLKLANKKIEELKLVDEEEKDGE